MSKLPSQVITSTETSLLDVIDNVLNKGVVIHGELMLGVAGVDLVYVRVSALLSAVDRVFPDCSSAERAEAAEPIAGTSTPFANAPGSPFEVPHRASGARSVLPAIDPEEEP